MTEIAIFLSLGILSGAVNSVAGAGSLFIYPLLIGLGIAPINANATTSMVVWPGNVSSAFGYKESIKKLPKRFYLILLPSLVGGLIGAIILSHTPNTLFSKIVPWFFILAVFLIAIQPYMHGWLYGEKRKKNIQRFDKDIVQFIAVLLLIINCIYGGYFGAGYGIIMLGILGLTSLTDLNEMNGIKVLSGFALNLAIVPYFIFKGLISWEILPFLMIGNFVGGYFGARYSEKLPSKYIRLSIVIIGLLIAIKLFLYP